MNRHQQIVEHIARYIAEAKIAILAYEEELPTDDYFRERNQQGWTLELPVSDEGMPHTGNDALDARQHLTRYLRVNNLTLSDADMRTVLDLSEKIVTEELGNVTPLFGPVGS